MVGPTSTTPASKYELEKVGINYKLARKIITSRAKLIKKENSTIRELFAILDPLLKSIRTDLLIVKYHQLSESVERVIEAEEEKNVMSLGQASSIASRLAAFLEQYLGGSVAQISLALRIVLNTLLSSHVGDVGEILTEEVPTEIKAKFDVTSSVPIEQIKGLVESPIGGKTFADRLQAKYGDALSKIKVVLVQDLLKGSDTRTISKNVAEVVGMNLRPYIATLARTEIHRAASNVNKAIYQQNSDVIKQMQWCATLDLHVCLACANLDGTLLELDSELSPPLHPLCRCVLLPVVKSLNELGVEGYEMNPEVRASMNGTVPGRITFEEWFKDLPVSQQKEYLGDKRYAAYSRGELNFSDFSSVDKIFTLGDLGI